MKRDMDLIRLIAFALDDHEHGLAPDQLTIPGYTEEQIGYHSYLMADAGLIVGLDAQVGGDESPNFIPQQLTWAGHEFVDAARNDTVWNRTKTLVKEKAGSVGFGLFVEVLKQQARSMLGLA